MPDIYSCETCNTSSVCTVEKMVQSKKQLSLALSRNHFWVWQAGAAEDTQLHTEKFLSPEIQKRIVSGLDFYLPFPQLQKHIISNADQTICDDSSLNHTWRDASHSLMWGMQKNKRLTTFGQIKYASLLPPNVRSLSSLLYPSDLVSISLSFQTTTFHYSPPHPRSAHPPSLTHSLTLFPCLSLSPPSPLPCTPWPGAQVKRPKVKICSRLKL